MPRDYYEVLGVARNASADDIRKAHRKSARKLHPDVNKSPDAAAQFAEVQEAYDALSDEEKRKRYDQFGHAGVSGMGGGGRGPGAGWSPASGGGGAGGNWQEVDPETFESIFSNFGDFFSASGRGGASPRGGAGHGARSGAHRGQGEHGGPGGPSGPGGSHRAAGWPGAASQHGADVEAETTVAFETAALGGKQQISLHGAGGKIEHIEIKIPAGIHDGAKMRLRGKGHASPGGGDAGDLVVTVRVAPHPWFRREGLDIVLDVPITITEAALGASVTIPLLRGTVTLKVPAGVRSGRRMRVKGKGITDAKGTSGDFLAQVQIHAPESLSPEQRTALESISEQLPDPRASLWQ